MLPETGSVDDRLPRRRRWSSDPGVFSAVVAPRRRLRLGATFGSHPAGEVRQRPPRVDGSWFRTSAVVLVAAVLTAGCSAGAAGEGGSVPAAAAADPIRLAGVCPARIVVQGGWYPTADIALPFQLLGGDWSVDANRKRVSGSLVTDGRDTGVDVEFRSGGAATGFQTGPAVAYQDRAVTLAFTNLDEMIGVSAKLPMTAVIAPLNGDPQVLIWDPKTYPNFGSVQDIGQTDTPVVYSANASTVFGYLTGTGILRASQLDASYDGSPSRFVAARGRVVVQGYATNEPHLYEALPAWGRPVRYALIQDTGYPNYAGMLAVRTGDRGRLDGVPAAAGADPATRAGRLSGRPSAGAGSDRPVGGGVPGRVRLRPGDRRIRSLPARRARPGLQPHRRDRRQRRPHQGPTDARHHRTGPHRHPHPAPRRHHRGRPGHHRLPRPRRLAARPPGAARHPLHSHAD